MSASGAGRRRHRGPASPPESSSAGRRPDTPRPASSTGSLGLCAARAGTGVREGVLRLRRGLRAVLACALLAPVLLAGLSAGAQAQTVQCTAANADRSYDVPSNWALKPSGLAVGTKFRLLFVSSTTRNAASFFIRHYNAFVQTRAKTGHSAISDSCGNRFKVVASTTIHARDNTMTRSTDTGASIHWLNGAKVADDYADFWDGSWDSVAGRQESGASRPLEYIDVFTGSNADGTRHTGSYIGHSASFNAPLSNVTTGSGGYGTKCTGGPIDSGCITNPTNYAHFYGLSPVFTVTDGREVSLGAANYEVGEGDAVTVTLKLKWPQSTATTVGIACTHGTTAAGDFTACPATVAIPANAGTHTFDIQTTKDTTVEVDETFVVAISSVPAGFRKGAPSAATVTVVDAPVLSIEAPADADEGDSGTTDRIFTVRLSKPVAQAFTFRVCWSGTASRETTRATTIPAGKDYQAVVNSGPSPPRCPTGLIAAGATSSTQLGIRVKGDTDREGDETVVATLSIEGIPSTIALGIELGTSTATHTIRGDDRRVLSISAPADADEGDSGTTDRIFTVRLSKPVAQAFTFRVCWSGTASRETTRATTIPAGKDYQAVVNSGPSPPRCPTGLIAAGATSSTQLGIRVKGDTDREGDETVVATLSIEGIPSTIALGIELGTSTATHTIRGDDRRVLSISAPADANEGDSGTTDRIFTVRLSKPVAQAFTFRVCWSGTASRETTRATTIPAGKDYQAVVNSGPSPPRCPTGLIAAGATSSTQLGIRVKGDTDREGDETVVATLSIEGIPSTIALGIELGTSTATHTIRGDDRRVLSISAPADADEGDSGTTDRIFTVRLSKPVAQAFTFRVCWSGTASRETTRATTIPAGKDYQAVVNSGPSPPRCPTGLIAAGATSSTQLGIRVKGDTDREGDETVVATLSIEGIPSTIALGIELGTSTATHTIRGDDGALPVVRVTPGTSPVTEGEEARFTVTRGGTVEAALTVALVVRKNGAFFGPGTPTSAPKVTIPAGRSSVGFAVPTGDDDTGERDGWVEVWVQDSFSAYLGDYEPHRHGDYYTYEGRYNQKVHYPYETAGRHAARVTVLDDEVGAPVTADLFDFGLPGTGLPEGATGRVNLTLNRVLETWETVTVALTLGGDATRGADYTLRCENVAGISCRNLTSGAPSLTIDGARLKRTSRYLGQVLYLTAVEDNTDEPAEPVTLRLGGGRTLSFNIVDAPDAVTIAFTRSSFGVRENNGPAEPCMRITPPAGRDIPLHFTLGGTATEGRTGDWDFHFQDAPPVLRAGERVACFAIRLRSDARDEPDKTVVLALDTARLPSGVTLEGVPTVPLTILDKDPTVVSLARTGTDTVTEGDAVGFTVTLGRALVAGEVLDVPLAVSGTGVTPADWRLVFVAAGTDLDTGVTLSGEATATPRLRFAGAGARTATLALETVDDGLGEGGAETFAVALGPNSRTDPNGFDHARFGTNVGGGADPHPTRNRFTVEVRDGAGPPLPALTIAGGPAVVEGTAARFTVTARPAPASNDTLIVDIGVADAPGADFLASSLEGDNGVWEFEGGAASRTFTLATEADDTVEPSGPVTVTLRPRAGEYTVGDPASATVTVNDDDTVATPTVRFAGAHYSAAEGAAASVTVRISPRRSSPTAVGLTYANGTAASDDYAAAPASVTIAANAASHTFTVQTTGDSTGEPDETFTIAIGALPDGVVSASPSSTTVTITDDDPAPVPVVTIARDASPVTEGTAAAFTVSASAAPASALAVTVEVAETPGGGFVAADDEGTETVTIPPGETSATLSVPTLLDDTDEPGAQLTATVAAGGGYTVGTAASATVALADDDPTTVTLSGSASAIPEAGGTKVLTFTLNRALVAGERLDVPVTVGGTATHRDDFGLTCGPGLGCRYVGDPGGEVFFVGGPDAVRTATLTVTAVDDGDDEGSGETVTVALGTPGGNLDGGATASGSVDFVITDDDDPLPVVAIAGGAAVTEGTPAVFTVSADRAPAADLEVVVDVSDAPASDFLASGDEGAKTVTIRPGETSATLTVPTQPDDADEPDGPVRAVLVAGAGYRLGAASAAAVAVADDDATAGPTLSIDDATLAEGAGQRPRLDRNVTLMRFTIRLSAPQPHWVRVTATARDSTPVSARGRQDYIPARLFAEFLPGRTVAHVWVQIVDDSHDEDDETFEVVLSEARGAAIADAVAVGTITNDDPMPAAWLARFGRTVAEQALDGISGRMAAPRTPGMAGTLAGRALGAGAGAWSEAEQGLGTGDGAGVTGRFDARPDRLGTGSFGHDTAGFGEPQSEPLTMRDALLGSRFTLTGAADGAGGSLSLWGRAAHGRFDGHEGTFSLDGEATTALLGADYARGGWLVGLALAQSEGEGAYRDTKTALRPASRACPGDAQDLLCAGAVREGDGTVDASLTAALPYASLQASQRLTLWGALGYGEGDVTLATAMGGRYRADTTWRMAAAGLRGDLLEAPAEGSGPALALTSDALWARTASEKTLDLAASASDVTRLRLGLEGSWRFSLDGGDAGAAPGASLVPKLELGARHDGGDAETGLGIELGGGIAWVHPALGLSLDVSGRTLIAHEDGALEDRGFAAALGFDPRPETERGPSFSLRQNFGGQATGGLDALFAPATLDERSGAEATSRWTAEAAYGLPAFGGRWTASPHAGLGLAPGTRDLTLGWRWTPAENAHPLSFGLKATRRQSDGAAPEHAVGFEASARW